MKLQRISYKGSYQPPRSNKHMSRERKAKLRGSALRRLLLVNVALYGLGAVAALAGNPAMLLLPIGVSIMLVLWAVSEYLGDAWENGMMSAERAESRERVSEREVRRELRRKGQDPDKVAKRLDRGDAVHISDDGEIVFNDQPDQVSQHHSSKQ